MVLKIIYYGILLLIVVLNVLLTVCVRRKGKQATVSSDTVETDTEQCKETVSASDKLKSIIDCLPDYIEQAEEFYNRLVPSSVQKTGAEKLRQVLDKLKIDCLTMGVDYNEEFFKSQIEKLIDLTKKVNNKN